MLNIANHLVMLSRFSSIRPSQPWGWSCNPVILGSQSSSHQPLRSRSWYVSSRMVQVMENNVGEVIWTIRLQFQRVTWLQLFCEMPQSQLYKTCSMATRLPPTTAAFHIRTYVVHSLHNITSVQNNTLL